MEPTEECVLPEGSRPIAELRPGEKNLIAKMLEEFKDCPDECWREFSPDLSGLGVKREEPGALTWWKRQMLENGLGLGEQTGEPLGLTWRQLHVLCDAFSACYAGPPEDKCCMMPPFGCRGAFADDMDLEPDDLLTVFVLCGHMTRWIDEDRRDRPDDESQPGIPGPEVWLTLKYLSEHATCIDLSGWQFAPKTSPQDKSD
jgi:hypothetical protein